MLTQSPKAQLELPTLRTQGSNGPTLSDRLPVETGGWAGGKGGSSLSDMDPGVSLDDSSIMGDGRVACGGSIRVNLEVFFLVFFDVLSFLFLEESRG